MNTENVLIIEASPRKNGNTAWMSSVLSEALKKTGGSVEIVRLYDLEIRPCTDCRACFRADRSCPVQDDMQSLYRKMEEADILVFATPIYWYSPSGPMKTCMDRMRCYFQSRRLSGKVSAALLPAADGEPDCLLSHEMYERMGQALGMDYRGYVAARAYETGDASRISGLAGELSDLAGRLCPTDQTGIQ